MTNFLNRVGDRMNPIVVKEARQAVNSRLVSGILLLFLGVQLAATLLIISNETAITPPTPGTPPELNLGIGRELFMYVQGILVVTCMLLIPVSTGVRLAVERSDVNVDLLFISSLSARSIVAGKVVTAAAVALLIFSACAPFMTFAYVLRGLDMPTILLVLFADFLAVLLGTALAVFLAAIPATRGFRIFLGIFGFIALCYVCAGAVAISGRFLEGGVNEDTSSWEFWAACAGLAGVILGVVGLFFVWSVAMISPASANKALSVRVYTLAFWLAGVVGCGYCSYKVADSAPVIAWTIFGTILFGIQLLTAIGERDSWGPRVARHIPRRTLPRVVAFVFYSGAAGGLLFGAFGGALTVAAALAWHEWYPSIRWPTRWTEEVTVCGLILGYTYCYGMSAVLVRRALRGTAMRPGFTWLAALILFGLGSVIPFIIRYAVYETESRYGFPSELIWLYLPSPVVMVDDAMQRWGESHTTMTVTFLIGWGAVVTLLNARWLAGQVRDFRPPRAAPTGEAA